MVKMGNAFYFMFVGIAAIYLVVLVLLLKNKSEKTVHKTLVILLFINFALHFIKQFFPPYSTNFPTSLRRSTFENICAVTTMLFPFIYLIKKQNVLHDYMFFIGVCGGLGALFFPTEALGHEVLTFDVLRFYFCHIHLVVVPLVAAILHVYSPKLKSFWAIPFLFLAQEAIICINEFVLIGLKLLDCEPSQLLDRTYRNTSMVFGMNPTFDGLKGLFDALVPSFFKTDAFHINGGVDFYFPVLWLTIPAIVFLPPVYIILSSPFWITELVKKRKTHNKILRNEYAKSRQ